MTAAGSVAGDLCRDATSAGAEGSGAAFAATFRAPTCGRSSDTWQQLDDFKATPMRTCALLREELGSSLLRYERSKRARGPLPDLLLRHGIGALADAVGSLPGALYLPLRRQFPTRIPCRLNCRCLLAADDPGEVSVLAFVRPATVHRLRSDAYLPFRRADFDIIAGVEQLRALARLSSLVDSSQRAEQFLMRPRRVRPLMTATPTRGRRLRASRPSRGRGGPAPALALRFPSHTEAEYPESRSRPAPDAVGAFRLAGTLERGGTERRGAFRPDRARHVCLCSRRFVNHGAE